MSLYGDLPPLPSEAGGSTTASTTTATTATPSSTTTAAAPTTLKNAPPRQLLAPRTAMMTPAQRQAAIQAALQRSAANKAATGAHSTPPAVATPPSGEQVKTLPFYLPAESNPSPLLSATSHSNAAAASIPPIPSSTPANSAAAQFDVADDEADSALALSLAHPNEYDPRLPNEYSAYLRSRDARRAEERARLLHHRDEHSHHEDDRDEHMVHPPSSHQQQQQQQPSPAFSAVTPAPTNGPKLDLNVSSGEEAYLRRQALSRGGPPPSQQQQQAQQQQPYDSNKRAKVDHQPQLPPSRVLLLLNMVGRGDVDEELESETADECTRFGRVLKCAVFECPLVPPVPDEEAVRIFVKFESVDSAVKAQAELNGRLFAGRKVVATYMDEARFSKGQLAP